MTAKKKVEDLKGFREPTEKESKAIAEFFTAYFQRSIKRCKRVSSVTSVLGVIFMTSYERAGISGIIAGLLMFGITFWVIWSKKGFQENIGVFKRKNYYVLDGSVYEKSVHETPGRELVKFVSQYGEKLKETYVVNSRGFEIGTRLLLVYVAPDQIKGGFSYAFTAYMLTEEGIRKTV